MNADLLERDFLLLLQGLTVKEESLPQLAQAVEKYNKQNRQEDKAVAIQAEIAHWRQRAHNADACLPKPESVKMNGVN